MQEHHLEEHGSILLELLEESGARLHVLLVRLTLREDVAEELMQDLFIRLNGSGGLLRAKNRGAYARRAAINLAFDWRRKQKHKTVSLDNVSDLTGGGESPLGSLIRREELEEVLDAVGKLNKASRDSVVMRYIDQQSYDHIAEHLGMTPHHIRSLCHRARERLRAVLSRNASGTYGKEAGDV